MSQQKTSNLKKENKINTWKNKRQIWKDRIRTHVTRCCCKTSAFVERDGKDVWYWLRQCAMIASILRWEQNILNTYAAKVGFRILRCHFLADILSVRGTSWHSVLHHWIWINHQVQRLKPSQTQRAGITAEQNRRPWSSYWQAQPSSTAPLPPSLKTPVPEVNCPSKER